MKLVSKAPRMAHVKGITQFYLLPTRLSTNGMSYPAFTPHSSLTLTSDWIRFPETKQHIVYLPTQSVLLAQ